MLKLRLPNLRRRLIALVPRSKACKDRPIGLGTSCFKNCQSIILGSRMKILVIQLKQIGDVMMTTPLVRALKETFPENTIDFLAEQPAAQIYQNSPWLRKLYVAPRSKNFWQNLQTLRALRKERYDWVFDAMGTPRTAVVSFLTGAKNRVGFDFRYRRVFYNHQVAYSDNLDYSVIHKLSLLEPFGVITKDTNFQFQDKTPPRFADKPLPDKALRISVAPVSRRVYKEWPRENFAASLKQISALVPCQIRIIGGPGEDAKLFALQKDLAAAKVESEVVVFKSLSEIWDHFQTSDLYFGNDGGLMHFSVAAAVPSFAIFGKISPSSISPIDPSAKKIHQAIEHKILCKFACTFPACGLECLTGVKVEEVVFQLSGFLKKVYPAIKIVVPSRPA